MSVRPTMSHRWPLAFAAALLLSLILAPAAAGQYSGPAPILKQQVIFKGPATGCFTSLGNQTVLDPPVQNPSCPAGSKARYDNAYAMGFARYKQFGYFGTSPNAPCFVGAIWGPDAINNPFATDEATCEFGKGPFASTKSPIGGDAYPARIYRINMQTNAVDDITPTGAPGTVGGDAAKLLTELSPGIRGGSVESIPNVAALGGHGLVFLFGQHQGMDSSQTNWGKYDGLVMLALDADTGEVLGSKLDNTFIGIRTGVFLNGRLYAAARVLAGGGSGGGTLGAGGAVLKWNGNTTGTRDQLLSTLFDFQTVINFKAAKGSDNDAGHIGKFKDHLVVGGWNNSTAYPQPVGYAKEGGKVWYSPPVPGDGVGLTPADAANWKPIFNYADFDPDEVRGESHELGQVIEFDNQIVVGTYSTPAMTTFSEWKYHRDGKMPSDFKTKIRDMVNAEHAFSVFAIAHPGEQNQKVTLLYGDKRMPAYDDHGDSDPSNDTWKLKVNKLGLTPKFGFAGQNNAMNFYSWTWWTFQNKLYMGSFDSSMPGEPFNPLVSAVLELSPSEAKFLKRAMTLMEGFRRERGGDLIRMDSLSRPGAIETRNGYGMPHQYGTRSYFLDPEDGTMFVGTAGASNLVEGFRVLKLTPQATPVGPPITRGIQAPLMQVLITVVRGGLGAAQASPATVAPGAPVTFRARVRNNAPTATTGVRVCVRLPRGFDAASNPGATRVGRQVCVRVARVSAKSSRTVEIHTTAADHAETAVAAASAVGSDLSLAAACGLSAAPIAEVAQVGAGTANTDPCSQEQRLNDLRVRARPDTVRVRVAATRQGGVTG